MVKKNQFIYPLLLISVISNAQEIKVPSLKSLAVRMAAQRLYQELEPPQSSAERQNILNHWEQKAGKLFRPYHANQQGEHSSEKSKTETILELFVEKYSTQLQKFVTYRWRDQITAITNDGKYCCIFEKENTDYWHLGDVKSAQYLHKFEHFDRFRKIIFTTDNTKAISASALYSLCIWDLNTKKITHTLRGHGGFIHDFAITANNAKAVSASSDNTLIVWDINTGQRLRILEEHTKSVNSVCLTRDDSKAVSGSEDNTLKVWDINTGDCLHTFKCLSPVKRVTMTPDNAKALSISYNQDIEVWDLNTGDRLHTLQEHKKRVVWIALTTDSAKAISASDDKTLKVWDLNTGDCLHTLEGHQHKLYSVIITPDNTKAVSATKNEIIVWDINTGACLQTLVTNNILCSKSLFSNNIYAFVAQKNLIAAGDSIYEFSEHYQSIINRMSQPKNEDQMSID